MRISKGHYAPQMEDPDPAPAHGRLPEAEQKALAKRAFEVMDRMKAEKAQREIRSASLDELQKAYPTATREELEEELKLFGG